MSSSRQLAAIMFTDIVGYTALMGSDEMKAFDLLRKNRDLQKPLIKQYKGSWIKEIGDGVLASFNTITDAVRCAGAIHQACTKIEGLQVRIGIHLGEVVFENNDVFGDGVNIASRLQALAPIGGTLISEAVYKNVINKSEFITEFIREENLKNVNEPVKIYEIKLNESERLPSPALQNAKRLNNIIQPKHKKSVFGLGVIIIVSALVLWYFFSNKQHSLTSDQNKIEKSIAVLPFVNMSGDPQQEYFSDGLSEELINIFSRLPGLKVIGRTSSFVFKGKNEDLRIIGKKLGVAYLLEGSVRKSGNVIRITAQLIKANDATHLWSETYDREMDDIFKTQSEIARMIAEKFEIAMTPEANAKISEPPTQNVEAYELFQKGMFFTYKKYLNTGKHEDFEKAVKYFEQAIQLDSGYAEAYAGLAETYDELRNQNAEVFPPELLVLKEKLARKALQLKPNSSFVNTAMAWALNNRPNSDFDSSFYYIKKAYYLDPDDPLNNSNLGNILSFQLGLHSTAIPFLLKAIQEDPLDPNNYVLLGDAYGSLGKLNEAKETFNTCLELTNEEVNYEFGLLFWLIYLGEYETAERRLAISSSRFEFITSFLHASKGEVNKINPEYRDDLPILILLNPNKVLKEVILDLEAEVDKRYSPVKYNWLLHSKYFDAYRDDPAFKNVLAKAKTIYDSNLLKYGNIEMSH